MGVGLRIMLLVAGVSVAMGLGWLVIQQIQNTGRQEIQIEQLEEGLEIRRRIDESQRNAPTNVDGANSVLLDFLQSRD